MRGHAVGEDVDYLGADLLIFHGCGEELFSGTLVERDGVELGGADGPPARKGGADEEIGHEFFPDEGLYIFWGDEVLLGGCEGVGEVSQRAHEIGAATGRGTYAEQGGCLPELLGTDYRDFGEVMGADEEGIVVEDLSAGGLVVGVVQTDEGVAKEEGYELASGGFELLAGSGGLDDLGEIGLDLQLGVMGSVDSRGPVDLLALGEDGARHLKLAQLACERKHAVDGFSLRHLV